MLLRDHATAALPRTSASEALLACNAQPVPEISVLRVGLGLQVVGGSLEVEVVQVEEDADD
jgi:hypothetical protein